MEKIEIEYTVARPIWLVISYITLLFYIGYLEHGWWMSLCAFCILISQSIFWGFTLGKRYDNTEYPKYFDEEMKRHLDFVYESKSMDITFRQHFILKLKLRNYKYIFHFLVLTILDMFPFYAKAESFIRLFEPNKYMCDAYEGGFFTTIIILFTVIMNLYELWDFVNKNNTLINEFIKR